MQDNGDSLSLQNPQKSRFVLPILLFSLLFSALFNLNTSPFCHFIPKSPFAECGNSRFTADQCVYLYLGRLINEGGMPYRDTFDHKGPLLYLFNAFGLTIGSIAGLWCLEVLLLSVSLFFAYKTARLLTRPLPAAASAALVLLWYPSGGNTPETLAVPFLLIGLFLLVSFLIQGEVSCSRVFFAGVTFAVAGLLKLNLTLLWGVFALLYLVSALRQKAFLALLVRIGAFFIGTGVVAAPVFFWLASRGALNDFFNAYLGFNLHSYGNSSPTSLEFTKCMARYFHPLKANLMTGYNLIAAVGYLVLLKVCTEKRRRLLFAVMLVLLLGDVAAVGMKCTFHGYYIPPIVSAYLVFFACAFDAVIQKREKGKAACVFLLICLCLPTLFTGCFIPPARDAVKRAFLKHNAPEGNTERFGVPLYLNYSAWDAAQWLKENTAPGDTIAGGELGIYWYSHRRCVSKSFANRVTNPDSLFVRDELGKKPDYVLICVVERDPVTCIIHNKPVRRRETSPEIAAVLNEEYKKVYAGEGFDVYKRNDR